MSENHPKSDDLKSAGFASACEAAYRAACEAELRAFKPGNVSIFSEGHGMTVQHFRSSAAASAPWLSKPSLSLGERIYRAIEATRTVVDCNTNLGIVLLAAPLIIAAQSVSEGETLRSRLRSVLATTTVEDADWVYRAIRLARPGGLGTVARHDVRETPEITLTEAMRLAAQRDRIAYQYANHYADVFDFMIPRYHTALSQRGDESWAAVAVYSGLLARVPDSHIERKFGPRHSSWVADKMAFVEKTLNESARPEAALGLLREVDSEFKARDINPGTSADLTVACLLAVRLEVLLEGKTPRLERAGA
ncbi:MAG TPA: triphosphoribosyl-dephospho-CoA synthase [Methylococcus sp.]|nr:triphosphoribosyl-dephospho-CoA synthase [Methylococcus sp.]